MRIGHPLTRVRHGLSCGAWVTLGVGIAAAESRSREEPTPAVRVSSTGRKSEQHKQQWKELKQEQQEP